MAYSFSPSLSDLLHSVWQSLGTSMLLQIHPPSILDSTPSSHLHHPCSLHQHPLVWQHLQTLTTHKTRGIHVFWHRGGSQNGPVRPTWLLEAGWMDPSPSCFFEQLPSPLTLAACAFLGAVGHAVCFLFCLVAEPPPEQLCGLPEELSVGSETPGNPFCKFWGVSLLGWLFGERHLFLPRRRSYHPR